MLMVKSGDTILVHYTGTLDNGEIFDTSVERGEPLQFTVGEGQVIPGFDNGVLGMMVGQKKDLHIPAVEAYGEPSEEYYINVPKDQFGEDIPMEVGTPITVQRNDGMVFNVTIREVLDTEVVLDANHPLAGKNLNFALELVQIL